MADEVEIAKNSLDVLSEASELASTLASKFTAVSKILGIAGKLTSAFPFVGAVLGLIECFLPDAKHEEILRCFEKLSNQIDKVRDDIKDLEKMIKWEMTKLQYADVVGRIELAMRHCFKMGQAKDEAKKIRYQDRLKEVCANQNFTLALNALLDGIDGKGDFRTSILDEFYNTTKGNRPKVSALAIRLLQLVSGGMIILATYETVRRGVEGAKEETIEYDGRLKKVYAKVQSVIDRCVANFSENMLNDLNELLDSGRANQGLVTEASNFMRDKYDWLENFCLVYNDLQGFDKHCISGNYVHSFHRNGKCGVVFYRNKDEPPRFSDRYDEAYRINDETGCSNAQEGCNNIKAKLDRSGIGWIGCAVIRRGPDLWYGGNFSTRNATIVGSNATAIILLQ